MESDTCKKTRRISGITLVAKPKKMNQFSFNYDLKRLKEEKENSFLLTQCHSQVLQQKIQDLYISFSKVL